MTDLPALHWILQCLVLTYAASYQETVEGAREEEALMRVIMGGEIRVK